MAPQARPWDAGQTQGLGLDKVFLLCFVLFSEPGRWQILLYGLSETYALSPDEVQFLCEWMDESSRTPPSHKGMNIRLPGRPMKQMCSRLKFLWYPSMWENKKYCFFCSNTVFNSGKIRPLSTEVCLSALSQVCTLPRSANELMATQDTHTRPGLLATMAGPSVSSQIHIQVSTLQSLTM